MYTPKKKNPIQLVCQLTAMILIVLLLVSCGGSITSGKDKADTESKPEATAQRNEQQNAKSEQQQDKVSDVSAPPSTAGESYGAYIKAKGELVTALSEALATNPGTELDSMSLIGISMLDIALIPASCFGLGQDVANSTLGILGVEDVAYSESGNRYSVKYRNKEGEQCELQGEYDKATDALKCIAIVDGKESLISEYRKTSFGYVGQVYAINEDGSTYVYQLAVSGKDGAVGISQASKLPPPLNGNETIDFPKQCQEWYTLKSNVVTGITSGGKEISFVYTPSKEGE